jgi:NitT/TauT family transport system permease protein
VAASAVPIVALAPVFTTMFGSTTEIPRRLVVTVVVTVPVFVATARGLRQVRPVHDELMTALAATPWQHARFVRLPGAVPYIMTGLRLAAPAAVIASIVAEYSAARRTGWAAASPRPPPTPPTPARGPSSPPRSRWGCCSTSPGCWSNAW